MFGEWIASLVINLLVSPEHNIPDSDIEEW